MRGVHAVGAYHVRLASPRLLAAIEPALRLDLVEPDTDAEDDRATLVSAVLGLYFTNRAQLRLAVERQSFQAPEADPILGVRTAMTVSF